MNVSKEETNILEFGNRHETAHPASKNYSLEEFEDLVEQVPEETTRDPKEYYIHHMQESLSETLSRGDSALEKGIELNKKMTRLRESTRRLKYYLDEIEDHQ